MHDSRSTSVAMFCRNLLGLHCRYVFFGMGHSSGGYSMPLCSPPGTVFGEVFMAGHPHPSCYFTPSSALPHTVPLPPCLPLLSSPSPPPLRTLFSSTKTLTRNQSSSDSFLSCPRFSSCSGPTSRTLHLWSSDKTISAVQQTREHKQTLHHRPLARQPSPLALADSTRKRKRRGRVW